jgi:hypothetical protein
MGFKLKIGNKSGQGTTGFSLKHMNNIIKSPSMAPNYNANTLKKNGSPFFEIDPETGVERVMGKKTITTTTEKVADGTNIHTDTTQDYTDISGGKSYSEVGVSKEEGEEYWRNNPEARKEYEASLREPGQDKNRTTEFIPNPTPQPKKTTTPKEPKPTQLVNASLTKPSNVNPDGTRGTGPGIIGQKNKNFKNLTPKQVTSLQNREKNINANNKARNFKSPGNIARDMNLNVKGDDLSSLSQRAQDMVMKKFQRSRDLYNNNQAKLTINN